ncbi:hypothetical protein CLOM_g15561 [Closterium sp. NIES-68]|nr:hypothetical protein CLOM_g15561 [Closterium sp. NIES-68]
MRSSLARGLEQIISQNKPADPKKTPRKPTSSLSLFSPSSKHHLSEHRRNSPTSHSINSSSSSSSSGGRQGLANSHRPVSSGIACPIGNTQDTCITGGGGGSSGSSSCSTVSTSKECVIATTTTTTTTISTTTAQLNLDKSFWTKVDSVEEEARQMRIVFGAAAHLPISWNAGGSGGGRMGGGGRHGIPAERAGEVVASVGLEIAEFALVVVGLLRPVQVGC